MRRSVALLLALLVAGGGLARPPRQKPTPLPNLPKDQLCAAGFIPAYYNKQNLSEQPVVSAPSAVLMDFDTGEILYSKNSDTKRYPASTTKILTGLLLAENTEPSDKVVCNNPYITDVGESSLFIRPGDLFTAQALLYGFMLKSANDGGVVIAEHVAGSVPRFAELMTARAKELGAKNSNFKNPHGLHNSQHYTTARDLALIAREAMRNFRFAEAVSIPRRSISRVSAAGV
jgi:serine-type D-Ala-D-Ala carboxypeptidase (penicillin-binding protein 5/6)